MVPGWTCTLGAMAIPRVVDRVGQVLGGRYRLMAPIGTGASASVYLGDDVVLRRRVAVKVLHAALADDEAFLRRFRAEAQAAAALNHPHVLAVYDWGEDGDVPYLVMELLGGGSLRALLDTGVRLSLSQALLVGLEAARGLEYAHKRGFVHRDIKPANLLFDEEGRLRIADFGLARALAEAAWTEPMGAVLGTAKYASPEQARGEVLDGRSDVYSLALVVVEAVTGVVPFAADTSLGTLMARVGRPLEVPEVFGPLRAPLAAAGLPDPDDRPDAARFGLALLAAAGELDRPAPLPLAGVRTIDVPAELLADPTVVEPPGGGRWALGPDAAPTAAPSAPVTGSDTVVVDLTAPGPGTPAEAGGEIEVPDWVATPPASSAATTPSTAAAVASTGSAVATLPPEGAAEGAADGEPARNRRRWPRRLLMAAVVASLLAGGGAVAWQRWANPVWAVPVLVGATADDAAQQVGDHGWTLQTTERHDEVMAAGQVLEQQPAAGVELGGDGVVSIVVSRGPPPVAVPNEVVGMPLADAGAALVAAGLETGAIEQRFDENVPADSVVALGDGVPDQLPKGSPVALVVSKGPEPRTIPAGLAGIAEEDAVGQLEALDLVPDVVRQPSETLPEGQSLGTDPGPGEQVPKGATVTVIVSSGPPTVVVRDVRGMSVLDAAAALEEQGLEVTDTEGSPRLPVVATDPPAGTTVRVGSGVTLQTGRD